MKIPVKEIAEKLGAEVVGDSELEISGIQPLDSAKADDISFYVGKDGKRGSNLFETAKTSGAGALLVREKEESFPQTQLVVENPMSAIMALSSVFYQTPKPNDGVHPKAEIDPTATIGENVSIGAFAVVGRNVTVGDGSIIHPHVVLYPGSSVGKNCIIHSSACIREFVAVGDDCQIQNGAVVGSDGFGYLHDEKHGHRRIPHIGTAALGNQVDIGSNSTIDRAMLGKTSIAQGTKVDNLVMIGHNVSIGARSILCGQVGISGSTKIGDNVILAGQVGVRDHVEVGDNVQAAARSGIITDIKDHAKVAGMPAIDFKQWVKCISGFKKLPNIMSDITTLKKNGLRK